MTVATAMLQSDLAAQAQRRGDEIALVMGEEALTYGRLDALSSRLARLLTEAGVRPGDRVALLTAKSPRAIVAMIAVLKAGAAYVPLDPAGPMSRLQRILAVADPRVLLVGSTATEMLDQLRAADVLDEVIVGALDEPAAVGADAFRPRDLDAFDPAPPKVPVDPGRPAHILFTSGSTGEPKGVVITHANVVAFLDWAVPHFGISPGDRLSGHPPLHFDLSTFDVYGSLRGGAELHLAPPQLMLPRQLARFIEDSALTQWFSVPSAMTYLARSGVIPEGGFATLRRILWCGEVLPIAVLADWMRCHPYASFTNLYGPTEATIASSWHAVTEIPGEGAPPTPIGVPCQGEELFVLDRRTGSPAPVGGAGELVIAGAGISPGYWRDAERGAEVFIDDPRQGRTGRVYRTGDLGRRDASGVFHFMGRADSQIKSRGYRIELGEIEAAVNGVAGVGECAIVAIDTAGFEGKEICCVYAPAGRPPMTPAQLRACLQRVLPSYMLPSRWELTSALPKNVNGKIDRRVIAERFRT